MAGALWGFSLMAEYIDTIFPRLAARRNRS